MPDGSNTPYLYEKFNDVQAELLHRVWKLTHREIDVLNCLMSGLTNEKIAAALNAPESPMNPETVKTHLSSITSKTKGGPRTEVAVRTHRILTAASETEAYKAANEKTLDLQLTSYQKAQLHVRGLTSRQIEVLNLIQHPNKVIGKALGIFAGTVNTHIEYMLPILGCENRTQAAMFAIRLPNTPPEGELWPGVPASDFAIDSSLLTAPPHTGETTAERALETFFIKVLQLGAKIDSKDDTLKTVAKRLAAALIGNSSTEAQTTGSTRPEVAAQTGTVGAVKAPEYNI